MCKWIPLAGSIDTHAMQNGDTEVKIQRRDKHISVLKRSLICTQNGLLQVSYFVPQCYRADSKLLRGGVESASDNGTTNQAVFVSNHIY